MKHLGWQEKNTRKTACESVGRKRSKWCHNCLIEFKMNKKIKMRSSQKRIDKKEIALAEKEMYNEDY